MRRLCCSLAILALALAPGCGGGEVEEETPILMGKIPASVLKVAREKLGGVQFESATRAKSGGVETYAIKGKDGQGKPHSIAVTRDGKVLRSD